ncbi:MAG: S8 family serine peptidase [Clostridia bacterium]|nr:S8 family serine peptidase [Clostridia bacterium]
MKNSVKRFASFVICCILCGVFCLFSSAKSTNEYGLGLTADSSVADSSATVTLSLKNSNSFDVNDIEIVHNLPEGLELKSEIAGKNSEGCVIPVGSLAAGDTYKSELVFNAINAPVITDGEASANSKVEAVAVKKANEKTVIAAVVAAVVIVAVVIIFARKHKKAAAMLLALTMLTPVTGMFVANAAESRSFTLEDSITIGDTSYPISITVEYTAESEADFELEAEDAAGTVTRPVADFSGTAVADSTVMSVTYEVRSDIDGFEVGSSGTASLDGCEWSVDNLALKHGDNKVTFTATLTNGEALTQVQNICYDPGELYNRTAAEEAEENGTKYVKEIVNIYFDINTTEERIEEILSDIGAERVGEVNDIAMVQARVEAESLDALNKKCEEIEEYDEVVAAGIEQILPLDINAVTNDPWSTYVGNKETRNEEIPDGYNWHVEAIQAHSAWDYQSFFGKATVGIIDGPVMTDHEDMLNKVKFSGSYQRDNTFSSAAKDKANEFHGTHVASVIGATQNNSLGVAGLLKDVDIYAANFGAASNTISYIVSAVSSQVTNGATAVNLSLGLNNTTGDNPYLNPYSTEDLDAMATQCAVGMYTLIKSGKEFVVVQSAGNGVIDTRLGNNMYRSVDATQNGLYCSVRTNGSYGSLTRSQVQAVYDRIIVVGAAENDSNVSKYADFTMYYRSNAGDRVDVYAPGYRIMGAVTPQADSNDNYTIMYGMATGTSQAAPQVTAVAALCFAINPNLTGAQVKTMIKENTRCDVKDNTQTQKGTDNVYYELHPATGNGRMLSMKLVAEAAMRTVVGKANYTQLNRIVAAAQSLDPNTFTNYEIVQAVIDSIDYNLYAYQQDEVDAKYIELLDAMDKLIERTSADYSDVEKAKAEAAALNPDDYVDFSGVTSAVNAVVYGKYSDEQAQVDAMAQAIRDAISALVIKAELSTSDPSVVPDNLNRIIVLTSDYIDTYSDYIDASGGYTVSFKPNSSGKYSTGATATMSKEGYEDIVYTVAVLGDIDGNGKADANDAFLARMCAVGLLELNHTAYNIAADANCDGEITEADFILIQDSAIFNDFIFNDYTPGE